MEQFGDLMFRAAIMRVGDRDVAEDLVQEAFLAAWKNRDSFDGRSERSTWLVAILRRKIADHFRRVGRSRESVSQIPIGDEQGLFDQRGVWRAPVEKIAAFPENRLEQEEFWQVMQLCLRGLPSTLSAAYNLREMRSDSPENVCAELGISRQNLAVRLHRARLLLRQCLQTKWLGEGEAMP